MGTDGVLLSDREALLTARVTAAEAIINALRRRDDAVPAADGEDWLRQADRLQAAYEDQHGVTLGGEPERTFCRRCYAKIGRRGQGPWRHDEPGKDHAALPADPGALAVP